MPKLTSRRLDQARKMIAARQPVTEVAKLVQGIKSNALKTPGEAASRI